MLIQCTDCRFEFDVDELTQNRKCLTHFRQEPSDIRRVVERLRGYTAEAEGLELDMSTGMIWRDVGDAKTPDTPCKTIACFAGHYFMAALAEREACNEPHSWRFLPDPFDGAVPHLVETTTDRDATYHQGAKMIARDLGFLHEFQLIEWARRHPKLWGNHFGGSVFSSVVAFNRSSLEENSMAVADIADWFNQVRMRVEAEAADPKGFEADPAAAVALLYPALSDEEYEHFK